MPLCLIRDFNSIRSKEDMEGCVYNQRDTVFFNSLIEDHGLVEIIGCNYTFTWFGPNQKKSKLDRVLVNDLWLKLNNWKAMSAHKRKSYHIPLTMSGEATDWGPKPFKAFDDWQQSTEVQNIVQQICSQKVNSSWFGIMKEITGKLKIWDKNRKFDARKAIVQLKIEMQKLDVSSSDQEAKNRAHELLQKAYHTEIVQLKQKARMHWDIEGDTNTRFFHKMIQIRRHTNNIRKIRWKDPVWHKPNEIKKAFVEEFKNLFCSDTG